MAKKFGAMGNCISLFTLISISFLESRPIRLSDRRSQRGSVREVGFQSTHDLGADTTLDTNFSDPRSRKHQQMMVRLEAAGLVKGRYTLPVFLKTPHTPFVRTDLNRRLPWRSKFCIDAGCALDIAALDV